jgi:hypothetical protein
LASSAIEMYVRRSVCGVVCGSGGRPRALSRSEASSAASQTISSTRWRDSRPPVLFGNA